MTSFQSNKSIRTLADVERLLPEIYSEASARSIASSFQTLRRIMGCTTLTRIPADDVAWESEASRIVWAGHFSAKTPDGAQEAFDRLVKRVSAAIRKAQASRATSPSVAGKDGSWDNLLAYVERVENTVDENGKLLLPNRSSLSIMNLRARVGHVTSRKLSTAVARETLIKSPAGKADSLRRSIRFFNKLIRSRGLHPEIEELLPVDPIGALPILRDAKLDWEQFQPSLIESRDAAIACAINQGRGRRKFDRFGGKLGKPVLRGDRPKRRKKLRNPAARRKSYMRALSWLFRHGWGDASDLQEAMYLEDLLTAPAVERAKDAYVERCKASDHLKDPKKTSSLSTWLSDLSALARYGLRDETLAWDIEDLKDDEDVASPYDREMSAERAEFVRLIDYNPTVARIIVSAPEALFRAANSGLHDWESLGTNARIRKLKLYAAAAMFALQFSRSLRTRNLNELTCGGDDPQVVAPRLADAEAYLFIDKKHTKNRKAIESRIRAHAWKIISGWMEEGRPRYIEIHKGRGFMENDFLFPGARGALSRQALNNIWNDAVERLGIPGLTPHMMRHVTATLYLAVNPGDYAVVAAFLGDKQSTVEKFYARGEGKAAADLFADALTELFPDLASSLGRAA